MDAVVGGRQGPGLGWVWAKRARSSKSPRSFLFFLPSRIYALLALQLSLRTPVFFPPRFSSLSSLLPDRRHIVVTTGSWRSCSRSIPGAVWLGPHKGEKGASVVRGEEQTTTATAARHDAAFQIESDNVNAAGRLKIEDGRARRNRREFSRFALMRGDVHRARPRRKNAFLSAMRCDVFLPREILFSNAISERSIPEGTRVTGISRWRHAKSIFHILDNWKLYPFYTGYIENVIYIIYRIA